MSKFFQSDNKDLRELLYRIECKILTTHQKKKETNVPIGWSKTRHIWDFGLSENIWSS